MLGTVATATSAVVSAETSPVSEQVLEQKTQAVKRAFYQTLQERQFRYFEHGNVDLADLLGGIMAVFDNEYELYKTDGGQLPAATFYEMLDTNLKQHPDLMAIRTEEDFNVVFAGIYPKKHLLQLNTTYHT